MWGEVASVTAACEARPTTEYVLAFPYCSDRAEESASQCIILTIQIMRGGLLTSIRENMDALFKV